MIKFIYNTKINIIYLISYNINTLSDTEIKALKHTSKLWRKKSKLCGKRVETIKKEIDEVVIHIMEQVQAYQRAAQVCIIKYIYILIIIYINYYKIYIVIYLLFNYNHNYS